MQPEQPTEYEYLATLTDQKDSVLSLSFSPDGKYLAATGYAGVSIWDTGTQGLMSVPQLEVSERNVAARSVWISFEGERLIFILGFKCGDVALWYWDEDQDAFIHAKRFRFGHEEARLLSMDVYQPSLDKDHPGRLAIATSDNLVTMWAITYDLDTIRGFSVPLESSCRPKTIKFDPLAHTLVVFSEFGGSIVRIDCQSGARVGARTDGPIIMSSVVVDLIGKRYVAHTGRSLEIVSMAGRPVSRSIPLEQADVPYTMHSAFGEGGKVIITGTAKGRVLVFDTDNARILQSMDYPRGGLVQYVSTCTTDLDHLVAYAGSSLLRPADVLLYRKARAPKTGGDAGSAGGRTCRGHLLLTAPYWIIMLALLLLQVFM
ncbi:uncharacterized protein SCHCODRAFT_02494499 [Schizophyllum commune H4-8]|nr:uncharacterized protein SCHCODRAFT_02494499 [Schizophyllum commune H4-8]KAI5895831.1 hypothetical protein SCHCODRAFT_02494499 [Schizophyllum commune H4-8]